MFFHVCIDIENKKCLVIGGGKIAYKKIKTLSRYNSDITVIAEEIKEEKIREQAPKESCVYSLPKSYPKFLFH